MPPSAADAADFEELLRATYGTVYRVAFSVLANAADAEEMAQEVFMRAYRKISSLREREKFEAWVARMSWRLALNRRRSDLRTLRRNSAWVATASVVQNPETEAAGRELQFRLRQEIDRLPEKLQAVVMLTAIDGLDFAAVARILGIPEGTVRSRLHLARRQLLKALWP